MTEKLKMRLNSECSVFCPYPFLFSFHKKYAQSYVHLCFALLDRLSKVLCYKYHMLKEKLKFIHTEMHWLFLKFFRIAILKGFGQTNHHQPLKINLLFAIMFSYHYYLTKNMFIENTDLWMCYKLIILIFRSQLENPHL